jgi:hypothetical protein
MARAISSKSSTTPAGCLILFFSIFAITGLAVFISQFLIPCVQMLRARSWTPTPCLIKSSAVASRGSGKDLSFYPDVWYSYSVGGQNYDSTRFSFFKLSFNNTGDPQAVVNYFPPGASATCYVNPNDPNEAVLIRGFQPKAWSQLMSLLFVAIGVGGILWQVLSVRAAKRNEALGRKSWQPKQVSAAPSPVTSTPLPADAFSREAFPASINLKADSASTPLPAGEIVLKPTATPAGTACGLTLITLFWNGIVGVFLWQAIFGAQNPGFMRVFIGLFMIPFVLVGVVLIFAVISSYAGLFVARPTLTASAASVPLGGSFDLRWDTKGGLVRAQKLTINIEAREEAQYTRGTDTYTDRNVFYTREIFDGTPGGEVNGQSTLAIPAELMHSFEAKSNKILWALKVRGEVARWPDFEDEYRLTVTPLPLTNVTTTP